MARKKQGPVIGANGWVMPDWSVVVKSNKSFRGNFHAAMLYAHYECSSSSLKKEIVKYLKSLDAKHPLLERVAPIDENRLVVIGKYMFILNNGGEVPDDIMPKVMPALEKILEEEETKSIKADAAKVAAQEGAKPVAPVVDARYVITIQDRLRDNAREVAGEVEGWLDELILDKKIAVKPVEEFVNLFKANDLKGPHMKYMKQSFERRAKEAELVAETKDKDILEYYPGYTKTELKKFATFYGNILKATDMLQEAAKVVRAPRKKKPVSQEKLVAKLKFKKDDTSLGIVSINPVQIIGAKECWVYNTKTRKLAQFKAIDADGLSVKGASIINFSTDSIEKTLRKPAESLAEFKKASKVKLRTFLKELSTVDVQANGKLNEHHIILRVDK
jgi:hypothetical protein